MKVENVSRTFVCFVDNILVARSDERSEASGSAALGIKENEQLPFTINSAGTGFDCSFQDCSFLLD